MSYLLVHEVFIVALDAELAFCFLDLCTLFENSEVDFEYFLAMHLSPLDEKEKITSIFKLPSQGTKFLCTVCISVPGLAHLSGFTSSEADIWICIVCVGASLTFELGADRTIARGCSSGIPMLVYELCIYTHVARHRAIILLFELF
jgi:hypothetical protein